MTKPAVAALVLILPLAATAPAVSQGTDAQRAACSGDAFRLCASSLPNADKVAACLLREKAQLSPACRGVFEAAEGGGPNGAAAAAKPASDPAPKADAKAEPAPTPETPRPVAEKPAPQAAPTPRKPVAEATPKAAAPAQRAATRSPAKREVAKQAGRRAAPAAARQASGISAHRARPRRENSDLAQARYWMKRVTGVSLGNLAGLLPN